MGRGLGHESGEVGGAHGDVPGPEVAVALEPQADSSELGILIRCFLHPRSILALRIKGRKLKKVDLLETQSSKSPGPQAGRPSSWLPADRYPSSTPGFPWLVLMKADQVLSRRAPLVY